MAPNGPDPACRQIYLLSLWRETPDAPWRAALRPAGNAERIGFADLDALVQFLLRLNDGRLPPDAIPADVDDVRPGPGLAEAE